MGILRALEGDGDDVRKGIISQDRTIQQIAAQQAYEAESAKTIREFEKLEVTALSIDGALLPAKDLNKLANLPTRNEAIAQLMSVMTAPITKFVRTLAEPHSMLVRTVGAIRDQKQASSQ